MRVIAAVAGCFLLCASASFAQINIQGEDGSTVTIGPDGINVNGRGSGTRANVKLGPGGIQIDSIDGYRRSKVNPGKGKTVINGSGGITRIGGTSHVGTTTKRVTSTVRQTTTNTATRTIKSAAPSAEEQVTTIEIKVYGKSAKSLPLTARVEKLEVENLGRKGTGPLKARIDILAKELGVTITGVSTTIVNPGSSTVEITSQTPEALTINVTERRLPRITSVDPYPVLADMVINDNNQDIVGTCKGNSIVLNGNNCNLRLTGKLSIVTINGNRNHIKSDKIDVVVANGNENSVTWSRAYGAPVITNNGTDNAIHAQ